MWQQQANSSQVTHLSDRINISPLELSFQFIRIKSRLDRHMVGSVHLICISQTKGLTFKGMSTHKARHLPILFFFNQRTSSLFKSLLLTSIRGILALCGDSKTSLNEFISAYESHAQ